MARYTCPMHLEVESDTPASCPKCGMALEPMDVTQEDQPNPELSDMTRRFWLSLLATIPLFSIAMSDMLGKSIAFPFIQFLLATPVVLWGGLPFFIKAVDSIRHRSPNMFTLIAMGVAAAYVYSTFVSLFPSFVPDTFFTADGQLPLYFEASAMITVLTLLGQVLELRAREKTSASIRSLLALTPETAILVEDESEKEVATSLIKVGNTLRVRPGEQIPLDGVVLEGKSDVNESMLTGEAIPQLKSPGDKVTGGTINTYGALLVEVTRTGEDTTLSKIVRMVSDAQRSRAPIQRIADKVSGLFVPAVMVISVVTLASWFLLGPEPKVPYAIVNAVAVLIVACPCALGLATPMSIMVGTGKGATEGILFRNAEGIEALEKVDTLVVDKTGTITRGEPVFQNMQTFNGATEDSVLTVAAALEKSSEHPLARAVVEEAKNRKLHIPSATDSEAIPGKGIKGKVEGHSILVGSPSHVQRETNEKLPAKESANTQIAVAIDGKLSGLIEVEDPIKSSSKFAIKALRKEGVQIVMATGDNKETANRVAKHVGIDRVEAGLLPEQKTELIHALQAEGKTVAMAGDGINDAPALSAAQVGIAMASGSDIAVESAHVTLMKSDISHILMARKLSRLTMRNIRQNLFFAFFYNSLGVPIAAGVLYPFFGILLSPMFASVAMSLSSVSVIANALRIRKITLR